MRKILFLAVFFLFFLISPLSAQTVSGEKIQNFASQIKINKDGTIDVSENIIYDFDNLEKHGIYRIIPYIKENKDGKKFRLDFKIISVEDENKQSYHYSTSSENNKLTVKIGDPDKTISGTHTYVINYQVSGALTYFSDHDELYWNVTGNEWPVPILISSASVELPSEIKKDELEIICYTGSSGSRESLCQGRTEDNKINFITDVVLNSYQGLTIVVSFPKNFVAVLEPQEVVSFFDTIVGKIVIVFFILLSVFWYLIYPLWLPIKWYRQGRDPSTGLGSVRAWFDPPKTKNGRSLTPSETGALIDEVADLRDILATIIDLARRGYLKIVEKKKKDFSLIKTKEFSENVSLLKYEKKLLSGIFENKTEIRLKGASLYTTVEEAKTMIYEKLVEEQFFPKNPQSIRNFYNVISGLALFTLNFPLALLSFIFGRNMPRKTVLGTEQAMVAKSLKNFLASQERQLEFQAKNLPAGRQGQMFFEKLLPYAIAFGVEKVWAKRFENINLRSPDWYQAYDVRTFNSYLLVNSLNSSFSSLRSAATPTTSSSGFSSGFSGGSSGGGGGGGGGGSW